MMFVILNIYSSATVLYHTTLYIRMDSSHDDEDAQCAADVRVQVCGGDGWGTCGGAGRGAEDY